MSYIRGPEPAVLSAALRAKSYTVTRASLCPPSRAVSRRSPGSMLGVQSSQGLAALCAALFLLLSCQPAHAWYKPSTGPGYYSVGRASGLLSGIRRSPYIRRSEAEADSSENSASSNFLPELGGPKPGAILKSMAVCVKDIAPNLQSCELLQDGTNTFQCKADVFLSLDSSDCVSA